MKLLALALAFVAAACDSSGPVECVGERTPPGGSQCPAQCTECTADNICRIACPSAGCNDRALDCPPDYACEIACDGLDACDTAVVNCPSKYACAITCTSLDACGDIAVMCGEGACTMTCNGPSESCIGAFVRCTPGGNCSATCNGSPGPTFECGDACTCDPCM